MNRENGVSPQQSDKSSSSESRSASITGMKEMVIVDAPEEKLSTSESSTTPDSDEFLEKIRRQKKLEATGKITLPHISTKEVPQPTKAIPKPEMPEAFSAVPQESPLFESNDQFPSEPRTSPSEPRTSPQSSISNPSISKTSTPERDKNDFNEGNSSYQR